MEEQRQVEMKMLQEEKEQLQTLILKQTAIIGELEQQLLKVSTNNTALQYQQQELLDTVNNLISNIASGTAQGEAAPHQAIVTSFKMKDQVGGLLSSIYVSLHLLRGPTVDLTCRLRQLDVKVKVETNSIKSVKMKLQAVAISFDFILPRLAVSHQLKSFKLYVLRLKKHAELLS